MIYSNKLAGLRLSVTALMAVCAAFASADLKILSKVMSTGPRGPQVVTAVTYLKGSKIRIDNGPISRISDSRTGKTVLINHDQHQYMVANTQAAMKKIQASVQKEHMTITAHIRPTGKSKKIAGRTAHEYTGTLTANGLYPSISGGKASVSFTIDEWTTLAPGISVSQADMMGTISTLMHSVAGVNGMKQVTTELSKIKGIPLDAHLDGKMTLTTSKGGAPATQHIVFDTSAVTVNEGPLPDSVFQVPNGYALAGGKGAAKGGKNK